MITFLIKVRVNTVFSAFNPVVTEPLELCYLKSALDEIGVESYIIDNLFKLAEPSNIIPDAIVLTGYNVAENEIKRQALKYKCKFPKAKVIVGGVHIQGNAEAFRCQGIDYVCHSYSLNTFKKLIEKIKNKEKNILLDGVDSFLAQNNCWHLGKNETIYNKENIKADRSLFNKFKHKLRYLEKKNVALIKGSIGCPYKCSYCYCKLLNNNHYIKADYDKMFSEMENIEADYYWIIDDVLFASRNDALKFVESANKLNKKFKIIAYLRADFILREKDLLSRLKEAGLTEVIVGFETPNNIELKGYEKTTDALDYPKVIKLLKENNIDLTALFMVRPDYGYRDFWNLNKFIKESKIQIYTISILTPIKGTKNYEELIDKLTTDNPEKFDFLHLVLKPKITKFIFYSLFYSLHLRMLFSKRIWKFIFRA